jgi:hypothetical protein
MDKIKEITRNGKHGKKKALRKELQFLLRNAERNSILPRESQLNCVVESSPL